MLELHDVNASYGSSHVLQGISLTLRDGEVVGLLGRNGAGKTTTLLTIMGYLKPRQGRILYRHRDLAALPPYRIARTRFWIFAPQERGIFRSLTVAENLTVAGGGRGKWTLNCVYDVFPILRERARNLGFQLSGGEQQMLSIARALMLESARSAAGRAVRGVGAAHRPTSHRSHRPAQVRRPFHPPGGAKSPGRASSR